MRGRGTIAAVAAAAVLVPSNAAAQERPERVAGAIAITWRSDPTRCATAGLCGVSGSVVWQPEGLNGALVAGQHPRFLWFESSPSVARVLREESGQEAGLCVDRIGLAPEAARTARRRLRLTLPGGPQAPLGGRCIGPVAADVEPALPEVTLQRGILDIRGRKAFTAGPLVGEVVSTLTLRPRVIVPARPRPRERTRERPPAPRPRFRRRVASYELTYRVQRSSGALVTKYRGLPDPLCRLFDACGVEATATHTLEIAGGRVELSGTAAVRGGRPAPLRRALPGLELTGALRARRAVVRTVAEVARPGGATCRDAAAGPITRLSVSAINREATAHLEPPDEEVPEPAPPFRTRCPGPTRTDAFGDQLVTGSLPAGTLAKRGLRLSLGAPPDFTAPGYAGGTTGELVVELRRTRTRVKVLR